MASKSRRHPKARRREWKAPRHPAYKKRRQVIAWAKKLVRELQARGYRRRAKAARGYLRFVQKNV